VQAQIVLQSNKHLCVSWHTKSYEVVWQYVTNVLHRVTIFEVSLEPLRPSGTPDVILRNGIPKLAVASRCVPRVFNLSLSLPQDTIHSQTQHVRHNGFRYDGVSQPAPPEAAVDVYE
jgi:hypothetical protein